MADKNETNTDLQGFKVQGSFISHYLHKINIGRNIVTKDNKIIKEY